MEGQELLWMLAPAAGTAAGGLAILAGGPRSDRALDLLLGFTAGVMLAATSFSLLVPALERGDLWEVVLGFVLGGAVLAALDASLPHAHERFRERGGADPRSAAPRRRAVLLLSALTIHNVPEGLAVGVAFAAGGMELGVPVAIAITLQNIPEGFVAAVPLLATGVPRGQVAAIGGATGLVEPPAALVGFAALSLGTVLLPAGLGFAAAAMIYVVIDELLPECLARGNERTATLALLSGFLLMMTLDSAFG
jgi:zinc transporter, ZIP family